MQPAFSLQALLGLRLRPEVRPVAAPTVYVKISQLSLLALFLVILCISAKAQCVGNDTCVPQVPRVLKFAGVLKDPAGKPRTGTVGITFSIYRDSSGGAALWQESQNVQLDQQGRYTVLLGSF